jgi:2-oxoglutarate ferredoxin oxidoreductase subunit delta
MPHGVVVVDGERCKGCGLCIAACPQKVLSFSGVLNKSGYDMVRMQNPEACVGCAFCALTCPDVALSVYRDNPAR